MSNLLHLDASARPDSSANRPHGSHTRRLTARFVASWLAHQPRTVVQYRDLARLPPGPVTEAWIHAAFTPAERREPWMNQALAESDTLVDELLHADLIVMGAPMYNFGPPATLKAYIDNIVRVGRTFGFDRERQGEPYWPLLGAMRKRLIVLSARGDFGYEPGQRVAHLNHVEPNIAAAFNYMGIGQVHSVAVEYDEYGGPRLQASIENAELAVDKLVQELLADTQP